MSYALVDDGGKFVAGRVLSSQEGSTQLELSSGKRLKVKAAAVLLQFESPPPGELLPAAQALASEVDLQLAWEFAGDGELGFGDLADEYFSATAGAVERSAMLLALHEAPHYFRRAGKGRFRRAPEEQVKAALIGIERKRQLQQQIDDWSIELQQRRCPQPIRDELYRVLFKPDKNGPHYKAVVQAARASGQGPLELLTAAGAIDSPYQFHWRRFVFEHFPQGTAPAPPLAGWLAGVDALVNGLPLADAAAFSIDDSSTTEIDDALSVQGLGTGQVVLGIHIAVPALGLTAGDAFDLKTRERMSTVYMPGYKLTMLADEVVTRFSLQEGQACPALSLYLTIDETTLGVLGSETRLEQVTIKANLRHDRLDEKAQPESLQTVQKARDTGLPFADELVFLFRLAQVLKLQRETVRGKPEVFNRPDYSFRLDGPTLASGHAPDGSESVTISVRRRGAPLDLIVAECMILANGTWGAWLSQCGVPGIYRSQASLLPGVKVRMGTKALPHAGIGVAQYAWSTSPLRRYCDLVNQWQLLACVRHGPTAALVAPFRPKDAALMAVISAFDAAYTAYADFQATVERFWTLRCLQQGSVTELTASVMSHGRVRADDWPLVFSLAGAEALPRGARLSVKVVSVNLLTLELHAQTLSRIDDIPATEAAEASEDDEAPDVSINLALDVLDDDQPAAGPASGGPAQSH